MLKVCERFIPQGFHNPLLHHSTHHFLLNLLAEYLARHLPRHRDLHQDLHLGLRRSHCHCRLRLLQLPILLNCLQLLRLAKLLITVLRLAKLLITAPEVIELQHVIGPPFQRQAP